jgi:MFS family permease
MEDVLGRDRAYLRLQVIFFLCGSAFFMTTHVVLVLVRERFAFTPFELVLWLSVMPQLLLAMTSPVWGRVLDRLGMAAVRLILGFVIVTYLGCYFLGLTTGTAWLIALGGILLGVGNGGGQVTWALASTHFAPTARDVPLYNGIHFALNGVRGLVMPWVGAVLLVLLGTGSVLAGMLVALLSLPVAVRLFRSERPSAGAPRATGGRGEPVLGSESYRSLSSPAPSAGRLAREPALAAVAGQASGT